ncbi:MAG: transglutaminase domain-containing protein [Thermoplasmatales archaeon]|nr:transglutaminase domain-containing protein [Thermoplasmatales archaeon]
MKHPLWHKFFLPDSYWYPLEDALSGLLFGGICSAQANLQVALFRARGIPARILIASTLHFGKEKWMDSQHYIVEFYSIKNGWIKTQAGRIPTLEERNIILRIVDTEEEEIAGNGLSKYGGMPRWFWFSNENVIFYVTKQYMDFKLPKTKKIGFPLIKAGIEEQIEIPSEKANKIIKIAKENWNLFLNANGESKPDDETKFKQVSSLQMKALEMLINYKFEDFVRTMNDIKKCLSC